MKPQPQPQKCQKAKPDTSLRLQAISGSRNGHVSELVCGDVLVIGREPSCDLVLADRGVSRQHATISFVEPHWQLKDLGSTNGLQLTRATNGKLVELKSNCTHLENGDQLAIGEATLRIELTAPVDSPTELLIPRVAIDPTEFLTPHSTTSSNPMRAEKTFAVANNMQAANREVPAVDDAFLSECANQTSFSEQQLPFLFRSYRIEKKIGAGGMGDVFLATNVSDQSNPFKLAVKFLRNQRGSSEQDRARFVREMEISAQLKHSSIVDCLDCGEELGQPFIVMPYCSGGNLAELLKRTGALNLRRALRLLDRLLTGVEHAHQAGIVHRDLKPFNVLLAKDSQNKYIPKISDFGLAKSYLLAGDSGMTVNGTVGGSWSYMPKEQLTNFRFVSPQSDVWSLGAIFYECLTQKLPRPMKPGVDPIRTILESGLVSILDVFPGIPKRIADFVMKSLAAEAADRYKDAGHMRVALRTVASHEGIEL
jgi:pSer/pThr/pTyr-binding forkhead associated (FHA) protein